ncbi:tyrosine-type recombinase/integrase [Solirhodobacter olei]|uniref:tyrosine-type recombinase/integrase n=1 Tax=Solirhodobacter olei TaxID=2493082 RepID=UPI000FDBD777|nr:tyrosine-type recombinase/integrase [Solirhodobacter olei]
MATRLTQALVARAREQHAPGTQLYDEEVSGLRVVVGKTGCSYKFVGRINDGTDRYVSIALGRTTDLSLRSARERSTELRLALRRGTDPRTPKVSVPTVAEALERYLAGRPDLSPATHKWYREKITGPLKSVARLPADRIDREAVRTLHERLTRRCGPYGANGAMRLLKLVLNDVARTHDLPPNPVSRGVRMNRETPRDWAVPPEEMPLLWRRLDAMEDRVRRGAWLVMLLTGLRSHDARSMRWEHLDADGLLAVPNPKGGEAKAFRLPLPRLLRQELEEVRELTRPLESPFVFPSPSAKSGHIEQQRRIASFPYAPHGMRHTYRTMALEAGVDLQMAMVLMNHRPAGVTWNYVTRANLLGPMRDASERVAGLIASYRGK